MPSGPQWTVCGREYPARAKLDDFRYRWASRIRFGIEYVDSRGADSRNHKIAALDVRVRSVGAQCRTAGVPAKMVEFISGIGQNDLSNATAVVRRRRVDIDD
jgi:hypothetical protein